MIIKSNPVTEEVSAVDGHQLYKLITPQGEKKETQMGHLVSGYGCPALSFHGSKESLQVPTLDVHL